MLRVTGDFRESGARFLASTATLAAWRWQQQGWLLLVTGVGMLAAVVMVCALPLFSSVMLTAGLRGTLRTSPQSAQLTASMQLDGLSSEAVAQVSSRAIAPAERRLAAYTQNASQLEIATPDFTLPSAPLYKMSLYGVTMHAAAAHLMVLQGRLPADASDGREIALTDSTLKALGLHVGSTITLKSIAYGSSREFNPSIALHGYFLELPLRVVGSFRVRTGDPYWHGSDFEAGSPSSGPVGLQALTSTPALLRSFDAIARTQGTDAIYFTDPSSLYWYTALDPAKIVLNQLDDLINQFQAVQAVFSSLVAFAQATDVRPYLSQASLSGPAVSTPGLPGTLEKFRAQLAVVQIPVFLLVAQITALILFFVSVMAALLVDRQSEAISVLRSRGASGRQVLGSLTTQGLGLSISAVVLGPLLALGLVYLVASRLLTGMEQDALNALQNRWQALASVVWYALAAGGIALFMMIFSLYRAARVDILALRRETARSTQRPLWQRLRLDLWGLVIALTGAALSFYLANTTQFLNTNAEVLVASPLALIAPIFLLLAGILFFLRFFPVLMRLVAVLAVRGRGASSMLALAQIARAPRQPLRIALLLGLAIAFALFSLVLAASQNQRAQDIAAYQVGSDFSGNLPLDARILPLAQENALYRQIPGVASASAGYVSTGSATLSLGAYATSSFQMQIRAVDAGTFAQTALWPKQASAQPLADLLARLQSWRQTGLQRGLVPALVDSAAWDALRLHTGSIFAIVEDNSAKSSAQYIAIGEVGHIPTVDNSSSGGVLVDFSTMQDVLARSLNALPINHIWLRSSDSPAALVHVRAALSTSRLQLDDLSDRRALLAGLASDPITLEILGVLGLGATVALLLALAANVLVPMLNVRARVTSFAVLRALGTAPGQVVRVLAWEQGIVFALALLLGAVFGVLLSLGAVPGLIFSGLPASYTATTSSAEIFAIQQALPTQVILPASLGIALLILLGLCVLALGLIGQVALRPILGQALRLNED